MLRRGIYDGFMWIGNSSELASQLLWLLAKDIVICAEFRNLCISLQLAASSWDAKLADCKMIPLISYLNFLFGLQSWPPGALKAFKNDYLNFTHWVKMEKSIQTSKHGIQD